MRQYHRVAADTAERRSFAITVGRRPGYSPDAPPISEHAAANAFFVWMTERIGHQLPYLTVLMAPGTLLYGWDEPPGGATVRCEEALTFTGEASVLHHAHLTDREVMAMVDSLAARIGNALAQTRVYVTYRSLAWVLEAEGETSPRAVTGDAWLG